ncbi:MAG: menaquinone biosynthesis protein [Armatimonadetes bacterium]|nr:menaquinone biosynthesis protein [Armatimonadota bacterium]
MSEFRIGAVRFLNARPLVASLEAVGPPYKVLYGSPAGLVGALQRGDCDVGMIPVAAHLAGIGGTIVPGVSISCRGPVGTLKLFARCPLEEVRTLAIDRTSRTTALLARAILSARYGVQPQCGAVEPDMAHVLDKADAAVVIGQDALLRGERPPQATVELDLGEAWWEWQQLPLVMAFWVFREGWFSDQVSEALRAAREGGVAMIASIAEEEAPRRGLEVALVKRYFREMLDYELTENHLRGIDRYQGILVAQGMLKERREMRFA